MSEFTNYEEEKKKYEREEKHNQMLEKLALDFCMMANYSIDTLKKKDHKDFFDRFFQLNSGDKVFVLSWIQGYISDLKENISKSTNKN